MFQRNNSAWHKILVCKASSVVSHQTRWYNKRILRKGYSVLRDFSWIENYKLIYELYIIISNKISGVHFFFWQYILDWIKDNALKSLGECIAIIIASFNLTKAKWFWLVRDLKELFDFPYTKTLCRKVRKVSCLNVVDLFFLDELKK